MPCLESYFELLMHACMPVLSCHRVWDSHPHGGRRSAFTTHPDCIEISFGTAFNANGA